MYVTKHDLRQLGIWIVATVTLGAGACSTPPGPGLGEIMTLNQMRHAKLWLAGEAGNWNLADYELDELQEGFDDVVKYHPTHKDSPLPLSELVPKIMSQPMQSLRQAVGAKDTPGFEKSFDDLHGGVQFLPPGDQLRVQRREASGGVVLVQQPGLPTTAVGRQGLGLPYTLPVTASIVPFLQRVG